MSSNKKSSVMFKSSVYTILERQKQEQPSLSISAIVNKAVLLTYGTEKEKESIRLF